MVGRQLESVLVNEYLKEFHRTDLQWKRLRLGIAANNEEAKIYSVTLRFADAIVLHEGKILLIEAKLKPEPGVFGQLEVYKELIPLTPELHQVRGWPIQMILLTPKLDVQLVAIATKKGITYEVWKPKDWVLDV